MLSILKRFSLFFLALPLAIPAFVTVAQAQDGADEVIEEIVTTGSRRAARSATDSAVPIDVISREDFIAQGNTDMDALLRAAIPSYNVNQQPISDAGTIVRPANLRGLSPDSTLILVNGKRRHRSAVISFLGGGISDGSQGPDLSVIPGIALKQVEVLRDGASAQYGSDAIAGVINFKLRDNAEGLSIEARYGEYAEGDGQTTQFAANLGLPLTDAGFFNLSAQFKDADPTSRSIQRGDAADLIAAGNTDVRTPAVQIWGAPKVRDDFTIWANAGLELDNNGEAYVFGNWSEREVEGGFFFRNPDTRPGIFGTTLNNPNWVDGAPIDPMWANEPESVDVRLIADILGTGACSFAPQVTSVAGQPFTFIGSTPGNTDPLDPNRDQLSAALADSNCAAFNSVAPGGFTPQFGGQVVDASITGGFKGELDSGIFYDISASYGRSAVDYFINNTVNGNLLGRGADTPRNFRPGSYIQSERSANIDVSMPVDVASFASPLNVAGGLEYRVEQFEIKNGEPNSFFIDPILSAQGFGIGSNGFPGFKPEDAGKFDRNSFAAYVDFEADITDRFLAGVAVRFEDFSDFGTTTNAKVSARFSISDAFAIRGAVSTGFRAPTTGQSNVRNVTTAFTAGVLADEATLPPTNPIAVQKGGVPLQPEESTNYTFGAVMALGPLDITIDYFNIEVEGRIALTTTQVLTQADIDALLAIGQADASSFVGVRFFTNDFDTTTQGIDIVATMPIGDSSELTFTGNWTDTEVDAFNPDIIGDTRVQQLEDNLPEIRFTFTGTHEFGNFNGLWRLNHYGDYYEAHLDDGTLPIFPGAETTVDLELGYSFGENLRVTLGGQNVTDEEPDINPWADIVGAQFPVTSPMGFNGAFYYVRANWDVW
jgi:iron complex outermembrane receptor protein